MKTLVSSAKMYACRNATKSSRKVSATAISTGPHGDAEAAEEEDQADDRQQEHVAGGHVREETDRQREGLRQLPEQLDRRHDQRHQRDSGFGSPCGMKTMVPR